MTRRTWRVARRYVLPPLGAGAAALLFGRRRAGLALVGVSGLVLAFFRDPERETARGVRSVYAPADGLVREIGEAEDPALGRAVRVSTFLNLHDVHVNRAPFGGRVASLERVEGGYAPALFEESEENFRIRTVFEGEYGPYVVVQKAGAIARRITPYVKPGDDVSAGERIGVIHFGSRTDVLFPADSVRVFAEEGMRVRAGMTEIARYSRGTSRP